MVHRGGWAVKVPKIAALVGTHRSMPAATHNPPMPHLYMQG